MRDEYVTAQDVRRIQVCNHVRYRKTALSLTIQKRELEAAEIRLHPKDGNSVLCWVEQLLNEDALLAFKASADPVPEGSTLAADSFVLIIQTNYQKEVFQMLGNSFMGIDATHNTTHYENFNLFTLIVRDKWGHGKSSIALCRMARH
jgi:hypothetical protein